MIARLVHAAIDRPGTTLGLLALFVLGGGALVTRLELDALPDLTNNQVVVLTRAPGLTPDEVERRVTRPIEIALGGMPGLERHRSLSRYGISSVTAIFDDAVDPYRARQTVQERLQALGGALPAGVEMPELGPLSGGLGEVFHVTLRSPARTTSQLYELAVQTVAPALRAARDVVEVNTWGGHRRTLEVVADPVRLAERGLTLERLRESLERATGAAPGGSVPAGRGQAFLRAVAHPQGPSELGHALVAAGGPGGVVRVADVAAVREGALPRIGAATADGRGETVYLMAQMLRGANALDVVEGIRARLAAVEKALPDDVRVELVYDRGELVRGALRTVRGNLVEGGALVVAVLFLMLGSLRAGLLVAAVIPLSMLGAVAGMVATGTAGNLMSLGAIDFGLVVDGAVVLVEHVFHALQRGRGNASMHERVAHAAAEVASPVFFGVVIILLVYVPVLTLSGVDGKLFRPMALTVVFALLASLVLALTVVPAAAGLLLRERDVPAREPFLVRALMRLYLPLLEGSRRRPRAVAAGALALLGIGGVLYVRAGSEFTPQLDEGDLVIQTTRDPDTSIESAVADASAMEALLRERVPEVQQVVSRIGSPAIATDIMGLEQADVFVRLSPAASWRPGLGRDGLIELLRRVIDEGSPGADPAFTQPIQMRFNELLGGAVTDVNVSLFGPDLVVLRALAERVAAQVRGQTGAVDVRVLAPPDVSLVEVTPRPLDAAQHGFPVAEVLDLVRAVRAGILVGETWDGPTRVPIVLRAGSGTTAFDVGRLPVATASGATVPLSRLAGVRTVASPSMVQHEGGERRLMVGFNVRGADLGQVVVGAQARAAREPLPKGYRAEWGGQYETLRAAERRMAVVVPSVLALILVVLIVAFRHLAPALIILTHVPFASVGGMVALSLRGMPISMSAAVGFIALSGVAVLNGVVLMARLLSSERAGATPAEAALEAAHSRARPVLMTALVAALGFVPMVLATGVGAEVQRPLATVVVGGLVTSTILTLFILPTLYPLLRRSRKAAARVA